MLKFPWEEKSTT